jgi:hypothetical protein
MILRNFSPWLFLAAYAASLAVLRLAGREFEGTWAGA